MQNKKIDKQELIKKMEQLANEIITDPEKIKDFALQWSKGFHNYSFHNLLLIMYQKPGASLCAGFNQWKKQGRYVQKGEKAIKILAPFIKKITDPTTEAPRNETEPEKIITHFGVVNVFDVSQTDGKPLETGHPDKIKGNISFEDIKNRLGYETIIEQGNISNGSTDGQKIWITQKENEAAMTATLFHEAAHIELKHTNNNRLQDTEIISKDIKEMEAEAVSFLVCSAVGIENEKSKYYLGGYNANPENLGKSGSRIISVAEKIIKKI